ncbi:MAG: PDZ domain-containing protein [Planctomycetota bacterium]|nr:PDZ domain-containing protein [Planctomycetota bacterium]
MSLLALCVRVLALLIGCLAAGSARAQGSVHYTLQVGDPRAERVELTLELSGLDPEHPQVALQLPGRFAFIVLDEPLLEELRATDEDGNAAPIEREGARRWVVVKGAARALSVRWSVPLTHRTHPQVVGKDEYEYPYLAEDHGMLVCGPLFLIPNRQLWVEPTVSLEVPEGWAIHAPWPRDARGRFLPGERRSLEQNMIAIGAWDTIALEVEDARVTLAFAPGQDRLRESVGVLLPPILEAELGLFGVRPFEEYLLLFGRPDSPPGLGGSPKYGSMTCYVHPSQVGEHAVFQVAHLVAHEFFHTWHANRYGAPSDLRYVIEGWTDYYAWRVPAELGLGQWSDLESAIEEGLARWSEGQLGEHSLTSAGGDAFFEQPLVERLVYQGGVAHAALCEVAVRRADPDARLIDVLRRVHNDPRWHHDGPMPGPQHLEEALAKTICDDLARQLVEITFVPGEVSLEALYTALGLEVHVRDEPCPAGDLETSLSGTRVLWVDPLGTGARLGLRNGDRVLQIDGNEITTEREVRQALGAHGADRELAELGLADLALLVERDGERVDLGGPWPMRRSVDVDVSAWR